MTHMRRHNDQLECCLTCPFHASNSTPAADRYPSAEFDLKISTRESPGESPVDNHTCELLLGFTWNATAEVGRKRLSKSLDRCTFRQL